MPKKVDQPESQPDNGELNVEPGQVSENTEVVAEKKIAQPISFQGLTPGEIEWLQKLEKLGGVTIMDDGTLRVSRWDKEEGEKVKNKVEVKGLPSGIRMQEKILTGYDAVEIVQLDDINVVLNKAVNLLNQKATTPKQKEKLQEEMLNVYCQLEFCVNEFKVDIRNRAGDVSDLEDELGRKNDPALASKAVAALRRLEGRMGEIQGIKPRIALRKEMLLLEKHREEKCVKLAKAAFIQASRHPVFGPRTSIKEYEVEPLNFVVNRASENLDKVFCAPYNDQARAVNEFVAHNIKGNMTNVKSIIDGKEGIASAFKIVDGDLQKILDNFSKD